jgi:hypothetical protein
MATKFTSFDSFVDRNLEGCNVFERMIYFGIKFNEDF